MMAIAVEQQQKLLIGGEWVEAKSGRECEQTNPYSGDVVGHAAAASPEDVELAVNAAADAFEAWGFGPPAARREVLTKAADLMQDAFLKLWERWDRVEQINDPRAYLFRVALNGSRKRTRAALRAARKLVPITSSHDPFDEVNLTRAAGSCARSRTRRR